MAEAEQTDNNILERTVFVDNLRTAVEKLAKLLKPMYEEKFGENAIQALVQIRDGYEITFSTPEAAEDSIENGFKIHHRQYNGRSLSNTDLLVNLKPVSAYVDDADLIKQLTDLGCTIVGDVKHISVEGIEIGLRKVYVRLPENLKSLPRNIIVTANGRYERIKVFHHNQKIRRYTK